MDINNNILNNFVSNNFLKNVADKKLNVNTEINNIVAENLPKLEASITEEMKILLNNLNLTPTKENIKLLDILMQNSITLTDSNIKTMIQTNKLTTDNPIEKALFLISNKLMPTKENIGQIEKYILNETNIDKEIENLFKSLVLDEDLSVFDDILGKDISTQIDNNKNILSNIKEQINLNTTNNISKDAILKLNNALEELFSNNLIFDKEKINILKDILNKGDISEKEIKTLMGNKEFSSKELEFLKDSILNLKNDKILKPEIEKFIKNSDEINKSFDKKFTFDFETRNLEELEDFYNELGSITHKVKKEVLSNNNENSNKILDNLNDLDKNLKFMSNIKDGNFLQIPVCINNHSTTAELFVFSDKKGGKSKKGSTNGSALLSLNLANLGKLEAYIEKVSNNIYCQFKLEDKENIEFVRDNLSMLDAYLREKNLVLKDVVVRNLEEKFNILTNYKNKASDDIKLSAFNFKA